MLALTLSSLQSKVCSNLLFWLPIFFYYMLWSVIFGPGPSLGPEKPVRDTRQFSSTVSNRHLLSVPSNFLGFSEGNLSLALDKGPLGLKVLAMIFESLNLQCKKQQSSWTLFSDCREVSPSQCEQIINTFVICISRDCYQAIVHIKMQFCCQRRGFEDVWQIKVKPFCSLSIVRLWIRRCTPLGLGRMVTNLRRLVSVKERHWWWTVATFIQPLSIVIFLGHPPPRAELKKIKDQKPEFKPRNEK